MAASAKAWHAILYLIMPWQYLPKDQPPKTEATKAQLERTETCRRAGMRGTCGYADEVVDFASGKGYSKGQRGKFTKIFLTKISKY